MCLILSGVNPAVQLTQSSTSKDVKIVANLKSNPGDSAYMQQATEQPAGQTALLAAPSCGIAVKMSSCSPSFTNVFTALKAQAVDDVAS